LAISDDPSAMVAAEPRGLAARGAALWQAVRDTPRRRKLASLAIALTLEALILLLLLTLGQQFGGDEDGRATETLTAIEFAAPPEPEAPAEPESESAASPDTPSPPVTEQELAPEPLRPSPLALKPSPAPEPAPTQQPPQQQPQPQASPKPKIGARINPNRSYGPSDTGNPRTAGDSQRVGTAPNGEPLYAARWYREPTDQELAGYLSTANGPGYALIACKTVAGYYVEDCVLQSEGPQGSMMGRAVLAAAWQFRVRPARVNGREQFGSWVRIRIDYTIRKAPR
jgi:periplasmic protein TonB